MELDKKHICHCILFRFQKKSVADAHRICEMYGENVIAIECIQIGFNDLGCGPFGVSNVQSIDMI